MMIGDFGASFQMWATLALVVGTLILYATERLPLEVTSIGVVCALLVLFHFFPVPNVKGTNVLNAARLLQGFANPALVTVLALLVIGHGMVRTGALEMGARHLIRLGGRRPWALVPVILITVMVVSAVLNNTPVVVIFIPIMQALAQRLGRSPSKLMMPLSFAAILGGMTTLVGSSTNLLVNSALIEVGERPFGFFDFTIPGMVLAAAGFLYVAFIQPMLHPNRAGLADKLVQRGGRQFIAQIAVSDGSSLIGEAARGGMFPSLTDMTVRVVQHGETAILPPFEDYTIHAGDVLVVAATRKALTEAMAHDHGLLIPDLEDGRSDSPDQDPGWRRRERVLAEVMVAPASRFIGRTLAQIGFRYRTGCIVLGVQRRSRMFRTRMTNIRMQPGDELLIQGAADDIRALRGDRDVVLIESSRLVLPVVDHAKRALLIFLAVIVAAASGLVPIVVAALCGAAAMVAVGVLNVRQASRTLDPRIVAAIGSALAMSVALQETGGAAFIAHGILRALSGAEPRVVLCAFFLIVAVFTNILSNNASAVLFTPIAVDIALELGVSVEAFAVAVVFGANCSFASPLGYQTNLMVMGPGHYRFIDYTRAGIPLILVLAVAFTAFVPWYYGF